MAGATPPPFPRSANDRHPKRALTTKATPDKPKASLAPSPPPPQVATPPTIRLVTGPIPGRAIDHTPITRPRNSGWLRSWTRALASEMNHMDRRPAPTRPT